MENSHVLVIHSDPAVHQLVGECLAHDRVRITVVRSAKDGLSLLDSERVHVLVTGADAFNAADELIRRAAAIQPLLGFIVIGDGSPGDRARPNGDRAAVQRLARPVSREALRAAVHKALERTGTRSSVRPTTGAAASAEAFLHGNVAAAGDRIVAGSKAMGEILNMIRRCAPTDAPVLICGEADTGKEMIAREIHRQSRRANGPFVRVGCGSIREADLAGTLFGRGEAGRRAGEAAVGGLLGKAQGGTLFLDNVGDLPLWAQARLLDVLQQGRLRSADGGDAGRVDVRAIASTSADLAAAIARRAFLSRLYYYLNVVSIQAPPLRHRPQDVRGLAEAYLASANALRARRGDQGACRFSEDAVQCLLEYNWPGNILQLASVVAHAALLADREEIGRAQIVEAIGAPVPRGDSETIPVPLCGNLAEIERYIIGEVLHRCGGNKAAAARALGLHRRTLYRRLQEEIPEKEKTKDSPPLPLVLGPAILASAAGVCL